MSINNLRITVTTDLHNYINRVKLYTHCKLVGTVNKNNIVHIMIGVASVVTSAHVIHFLCHKGNISCFGNLFSLSTQLDLKKNVNRQCVCRLTQTPKLIVMVANQPAITHTHYSAV